jgi:hypothetical protein
MGRVSAIGSFPPCSTPRGSALPIENSPPGIHAIPFGAPPEGLNSFGTVVRNEPLIVAGFVSATGLGDPDLKNWYAPNAEIAAIAAAMKYTAASPVFTLSGVPFFRLFFFTFDSLL